MIFRNTRALLFSRKLLLGVLLSISAFAETISGKSCPEVLESALSLSLARDMQDPKKFVAFYKDYVQRFQHEPTLEFATFEQARNYLLDFPALKKWRFDPGNTPLWSRYRSRMENSSLYGEYVGWERKLENGNFARFRLDYEPGPRGRGAHLNLEIKMRGARGRTETYKLALRFLCAGQPCSERQTRAYLRAFAPSR